MAFTCGFFNSVNGDRKYNSRQISQLFDGIIVDGVFAHYGSHFQITPFDSGSGALQVSIGTGRFWFNHVWGLNDSNMILQLDAADPTTARIDAIAIEINSSETIRNAFIKIIKGNYSGGYPSMTKSDTLNQYPLAYITVPANATSLTASNISVKVGTSECPYATGVLQGVSVDNLFDQWQSQFEEWFSSVRGSFSEDELGGLIEEIENLKETKADEEDVKQIVRDNSEIAVGQVILSLSKPDSNTFISTDGQTFDKTNQLYSDLVDKTNIKNSYAIKNSTTSGQVVVYFGTSSIASCGDVVYISGGTNGYRFPTHINALRIEANGQITNHGIFPNSGLDGMSYPYIQHIDVVGTNLYVIFRKYTNSTYYNQGDLFVAIYQQPGANAPITNTNSPTYLYNIGSDVGNYIYTRIKKCGNKIYISLYSSIKIIDCENNTVYSASLPSSISSIYNIDIFENDGTKYLYVLGYNGILWDYVLKSDNGVSFSSIYSSSSGAASGLSADMFINNIYHGYNRFAIIYRNNSTNEYSYGIKALTISNNTVTQTVPVSNIQTSPCWYYNEKNGILIYVLDSGVSYYDLKNHSVTTKKNLTNVLNYVYSGFYQTNIIYSNVNHEYLSFDDSIFYVGKISEYDKYSLDSSNKTSDKLLVLNTKDFTIGYMNASFNVSNFIWVKTSNYIFCTTAPSSYFTSGSTTPTPCYVFSIKPNEGRIPILPNGYIKYKN